MRRLTFLVLAATASMTLGPTRPADAATVATPPIYVPAGETFWCAATNLASKPATFEIERVDASGAVLGTLSAASLEPGAIRAGGIGGTGVVGWLYCRIDGVSNRKVRITACIGPPGGPCTSWTTAP